MFFPFAYIDFDKDANRNFWAQEPTRTLTKLVEERFGLNMMRCAGKPSEKLQKIYLIQLELFLIYSALWLRK
jgi:hypothetical protein